jgi:cell division protein FtsI (penicillin-binding protein 3)
MNKLSNLWSRLKAKLKERLKKITRLWVVEVLLLVAFGIIAARLVYLHAGPNEVRIQKAQNASGYTKTIPPYRGRILDGSRNPNILALSLAVYDVCANPEMLAGSTNVDTAAGILSAYLKIPREGIRERLSHSEKKFAFIKRFVSRDVGERIMIQMTNNHIIKGGVYLVDSTIRSYPQNSQACHVVGFVNHGGVGSLGVEMTHNSSLTGTAGVVIGMKDGKKHEIYTRRIEEIKARPGSDVYLTLDQQIQYFTERALDEAMAEHSAKAAWAIVQRCRSGEILAMASRPAFDLNEFGAERDMHRMTNRAVSVNYEPGSTLKPVTLALAFSEGLVTPEMMFDCENGSWFHMGRVLHDYHPYPRLSVADVIKKSSNIGTAKIALLLGNEKMYKGLRAFGFGTRTRIELPYEEGGIVNPVEAWSGLSCSRIAIGQGVAVTALQMAGMMSAIANDGYLLKPYVIKSIVDSTGLVRGSGQPVVVGRPIDAKVAALMRYLLARVTEEGGTGTRARVEGYKVAGKTGTAQKTVPGGYSDTAYMASFAGFLPADKPEITIVVVVEEPQPYHTGGVVAAPVFAKIAEQTVRYLNLEPTELAGGAAGAAPPVP